MSSFEIGANVRHLGTNYIRLPGEEWHRDAPESPVSVQERMQRLELSLQGRKPHRPIGLGRVHVALPCVGRRMEPVCLDGDEAGLVCGTTRRPNPVGDPPVPAGRSTPATHPLKRCQAHRGAAVGVDPIAGLARDQAWRYHLAIVAGSDNPAVCSAAGGSRFVGEARGLYRTGPGACGSAVGARTSGSGGSPDAPAPRNPATQPPPRS